MNAQSNGVQPPPGFTARVYHHRQLTRSMERLPVNDDDVRVNNGRVILDALWRETYEFDPRGGYTEVVLHDVNGFVAAVGRADCHPNENYVKRTGRDKAMGRAISNLLAVQDAALLDEARAIEREAVLEDPELESADTLALNPDGWMGDQDVPAPEVP